MACGLTGFIGARTPEERQSMHQFVLDVGTKVLVDKTLPRFGFASKFYKQSITIGQLLKDTTITVTEEVKQIPSPTTSLNR